MFDSGEVFEEVLSQRLGGLHAFALFVAGDDEDAAEALLSSAITRAFQQCLDGLDAGDALDGSLVELALRDSRVYAPQSPEPFAITPRARRAISRLDPVSLRFAAAGVPAAARVAIWLVVVERRSYVEASQLIGVSERELTGLLEWRDPLIRAALADPSGGEPRAAHRR